VATDPPRIVRIVDTLRESTARDDETGRLSNAAGTAAIDGLEAGRIDAANSSVRAEEFALRRLARLPT
jgi:hypothetical protein